MKFHRLLIVVFLGATGCDDEIAEVGPGPDVVIGDFSDGEIARAMRTVNDGEILMAEAALPRLTDPAVIDFAERMIDEHSLSNQELDDVLIETGLSERNSDLSDELFDEANDRVDELDAEDDEDIDELYIDIQVSVHDDVLEIIEDELLDDVDSPRLEGFLVQARDDVADHLADAEVISDTCCLEPL